MSRFGSFADAQKGMRKDLIGAAVLGEMNFAFRDMGQGDCTIISCPDGQVIVVDCGSSAGLPEDEWTNTRALVRDWAGTGEVMVVLTHPDKDHYNKLVYLLYREVFAEEAVNASEIFFSRAWIDQSPLGYYQESALAGNLRLFGNPDLTEVTINSAMRSKKTWTHANANYGTPSAPVAIEATGLQIDSGTTMSGTPWEIRIIAGNVATVSNTSSIQSNVVSLCTLCKFGNEKLLLTGDATLETLVYLYAHQRAQITNVEVFQLPHHGSESSTPTVQQRNTINPRSILVSVGLLNDSYNLPRYAVLSQWFPADRLQTTQRTMDYWKLPGDAPATTDFLAIRQVVEVTWNGYNLERNASGTFFWLADPDDAGPLASGSEFYGITNTGYKLYRANHNYDVWETGILGSTEEGFQD